mgnify:CR=1 FL=1
MTASTSRLPLPSLLPLLLALSSAWALQPARASDHAPAKSEAKADAKAEPKVAKDEHAKPAAKTPPPPVDPMDTLRERLAEKLGATKPADAKSGNLVRVTARLDAPKAAAEEHAAAGHGAAPSAAPRKPSAAVLAAVDAHRADKAAAAAIGQRYGFLEIAVPHHGADRAERFDGMHFRSLSRVRAMQEDRRHECAAHNIGTFNVKVIRITGDKLRFRA